MSRLNDVELAWVLSRGGDESEALRATMECLTGHSVVHEAQHCPACERPLLCVLGRDTELFRVSSVMHGNVRALRAVPSGWLAKCVCGAELVVTHRGATLLPKPKHHEPSASPTRRAVPPRKEGIDEESVRELERLMGIDEEPGLSGGQP